MKSEKTPLEMCVICEKYKKTKYSLDGIVWFCRKCKKTALKECDPKIKSSEVIKRSKKITCAICEKKRKELFSFDENILFCRECAKQGVKEGETPYTFLYKYEKKGFVKFEIKNL